ncbi:hypothetical protein [Snodgrassella sp.]|uniref:hypothetical protein n=1 Tax=Snodgrassella sp. TaxID=2815304 RepID=UPI002588BC75|nr:hypothetical protein [Snodgrassella sp.]
MPPSNDIAELIEKNLQFHGYEVLRIDSILKFKYNSLWERIYHFAHKHITKSNTYKKKLKAKQSFYKAQQLLANNHYDYTLVIRPDIYPQNVLTLFKQHTKNKFIGYQWDGLKRFPVKNIIHLFDQFYIFDHTDLTNPDYQNYQLNSITNFYFDMIQPHHVKKDKLQAYYIGDHQVCRVAAIEHCAEKLAENGIDIKFIIPTSKRRDIKCYKSKYITFGKQNRLSYHENLKNVNSADILVDFVISEHNGLSFRHFEALYYQKKLITTNAHVKYYDFYHPNNIFIWDKKNLDGIQEFLARPFTQINTYIVEKYSFKNWIKSILD